LTEFLFGLAAGKEFEIHQPAPKFLIGTPFEVSNVIYAEWVIVALLILVAFFINRAVLSGKRTKLRGSMELLLDFLEGWYGSFIGGRKNARRFLPLLGSLFLFIITANYLGVFPTIGYHGSLFAPTGRWGTTLGLAIIVAIAVQYVSVAELGVWGWIKHLLHLGPLSILEEFVRPFSLSLRLFGNIFGEETLLAVIVFLLPGIAPIPIMGLSLLFGAIQAIVFTTLTAIYIGGVLEHAEHAKHAHGHHEEAHGHEAAHAH
jgi:F-type H+-transporting ATPase subunit a